MSSKSLIRALRAIAEGQDLSDAQRRETQFMAPAPWTFRDGRYALTLYGQRLLDAADLSAKLSND